MPATRKEAARTPRKRAPATRKYRTSTASGETKVEGTKAAHLAHYGEVTAAVGFSHYDKVKTVAGIVTKAHTRRGTASKAVGDDTSMLHVRITDGIKKQASKTLADIGMTTSEAIRLFLHRVVLEQRLPLDLCVPNAETQTAILEAREIAARSGRFKNANAMFESLEKAS